MSIELTALEIAQNLSCRSEAKDIIIGNWQNIFLESNLKKSGWFK